MISKNEEIYTAYSWIYAASYINQYNGELLENNSFSNPQRFVIKKVGNLYEVIETKVPRDGSLYEQDLKMLFPEKVMSDILKANVDGTVDSLQIDIQNQIAKLHN